MLESQAGTESGRELLRLKGARFRHYAPPKSLVRQAIWLLFSIPLVDSCDLSVTETGMAIEPADDEANANRWEPIVFRYVDVKRIRLVKARNSKGGSKSQCALHIWIWTGAHNLWGTRRLSLTLTLTGAQFEKLDAVLRGIEQLKDRLELPDLS